MPALLSQDALRCRHMRYAVSLCSALAGLGGCTHSDPFDPPARVHDPAASTIPPIQLTYNADQDYWPAWTQDGKGILYAYVDLMDRRHRCVGLLPAAGGTRIWEMCDQRTGMRDTLSSFGAFALDTLGRLMYTEENAWDDGRGGQLPTTTLWLSDTARPFLDRKSLGTFPQVIGDVTVTGLADLTWTGTDSFVALGQQAVSYSHCVTYILQPPNRPVGATLCLSTDTVWDADGIVLRGTISNGGATYQPINGTRGATSYSLIDHGATVMFALRDRVALFRVPIAGGSPNPTPATTDSTDTVQLMGITCRQTVCIVAKDSVIQVAAVGPFGRHSTFYWADPELSMPRGLNQLYRIDINSGKTDVLAENVEHLIYATPVVSPVSGDVVFQSGGGWGHLQTWSTRATGNLFLTDGNSALAYYRGALPNP